MTDFKVGDLVEIKSWDEMEKEFGTTYGDIDCEGCFTTSMMWLCGKKAHISYINDDTNKVGLDIDTDGWSISTDMIKKAQPLLYIPDVFDALKYCLDDIESVSKLNELNKLNEKEDEKIMKLVELYVNRAMEVIRKAKEAEQERRLNEIEIISKYKEIVNTFEASVEELYNEQGLDDRILVKQGYGNSYDIKIGCNVIDDVFEEVERDFKVYTDQLEKTISEVDAQLDTIENKDRTSILEVLKMYGIVDSKGRLKEYKIK